MPGAPAFVECLGLAHSLLLINAFLPGTISPVSHFVGAPDEISFVTTLFAASLYFEVG